jgi:hypothetical protein
LQKTVTEPFILQTGSGGAIGLGKKLPAGERNYANAGDESMGRRAVSAGRRDDERMSEEWNRRGERRGEVVGFVGREAIVREGRKDREEVEGGDVTEGERSGVLAALERMRGQRGD